MAYSSALVSRAGFQLNRHFHRWSWLVIVFWFATSVYAQVCSGPGKDGPNNALNGIINTYYGATASAAAGAKTINLGVPTGSATALSAGDMVLVIQMQDGVNAANFGIASVASYGISSGTAGNYEYALVDQFAANVLTLRNPLINSYSQATTPGTAQQTFQAVRVPQYSGATVPVANTVTPSRWNGLTGGIVAIDVASQLTLSGAIDASGYGFRGGGGQIFSAAATNANAVTDAGFSTNNSNGAMKGEGTAGTPCGTFDGAGTYAYNCAVTGGADLYPNGDNGYGAPGNAGGGGNDSDLANNTQNSGGGGGGNAGAGGQGGNTWSTNQNIGGRGGRVFSVSSTAVVMGGGGGAGVTNNGTAGADNTYSGAPGGGVVLLRVGAVTGNGSVKANGNNGQLPNATCCDDGGTGGGAGGSLALLANSPAGWAGISVAANGGAGSNTPKIGTNAPHGPGGGGGGGALLSNGAFASVSLAGGASGLTSGSPTQSTFYPYNASPGGAGSSNSIAFASANGSQPGAVCLPNLTVNKTTTTPLRTVPSQTTAQYVLAVSNPGTNSGVAYGVSLLDVLPVPFGLATATALGTTTIAGTSTSGPLPTVPSSSGVTTTVLFGTPGSTTNTFTIFPGGQITVTFNVNLNTTTYATFQNSASVTFTDPTRTTGSDANASGVANPTVSPGGNYSSGSTVGGSNYSSASSTGEDVRLYAGPTLLTITKSNGRTTLTAGQTTSYTVTVANLGPTNAPGAVLYDPIAPGLNCTSVSCAVTAGTASCPVSPTISALQSSGLSITPTFSANSTLSFVVTCGVTATGQ